MDKISNSPIILTLCRDCCNLILDINYDEYDEFWYKKIKAKKKIIKEKNKFTQQGKKNDDTKMIQYGLEI